MSFINLSTLNGRNGFGPVFPEIAEKAHKAVTKITACLRKGSPVDSVLHGVWQETPFSFGQYHLAVAEKGKAKVDENARTR
jgi:hypothetical protein